MKIEKSIWFKTAKNTVDFVGSEILCTFAGDNHVIKVEKYVDKNTKNTDRRFCCRLYRSVLVGYCRQMDGTEVRNHQYRRTGGNPPQHRYYRVFQRRYGEQEPDFWLRRRGATRQHASALGEKRR